MIQPGFSRGTTRSQLYNRLPMTTEAKKRLGGELQAIRHLQQQSCSDYVLPAICNT